MLSNDDTTTELHMHAGMVSHHPLRTHCTSLTKQLTNWLTVWLSVDALQETLTLG